MTTRREAIESLVPNAIFSMKGDVITWNASNSDSQPSDSAIAAEQTRLDNLFNAEKYKRDRRAAYPALVDQLDKIYHSGLTAWKADVKAIKDKFPKPN